MLQTAKHVKVGMLQHDAAEWQVLRRRASAWVVAALVMQSTCLAVLFSVVFMWIGVPGACHASAVVLAVTGYYLGGCLCAQRRRSN